MASVTGSVLADWGGLELSADGVNLGVSGAVLCDWGGLDVSVDLDSVDVTGVVSCDWGGLRVHAVGVSHDAVTPVPRIAPPAIALYDTDGQTWLANLPLAAGIKWQDEVSAPGLLSCRLPRDDDATALATSKRWLKVFWKGAVRQAARIDDSGSDVAVDGRIWLEFNELPGAVNVLGDAIVYPEYGLDRTSSTTRTFGYMSRQTLIHGTGDFTPAVGFPYNDDAGHKRGKPRGLKGANPWWIAKNGPYEIEAPGAVQYFRHFFTTTVGVDYELFATADDYLTLWVDGEQVITPDQMSAGSWRALNSVTGSLEPGPHVVAAKVRNTRINYHDNVMAFILAMLKFDKSTGKTVKGAPLLITDSRWKASTVYPGFHRAAVLGVLYNEARVRGDYALETVIGGHTFDFDTDSAGKPWADTPGEYTVDVGDSLLNVAQTLTVADMDMTVDPDSLDLALYNRLGHDRSATVVLDLGIYDGAIMSHRVERVEPRYNTALMQLADGTWIERSDDTSVDRDGRAETGVSLGSTANVASANRAADAHFDESANASLTFTTQTSTLDGPQPYKHYYKGDTISVPRESGSSNHWKARVMAITVDASSDNIVVTPELVFDPS